MRDLSKRPNGSIVTVAMCTYNGAQFLREQLAGILNQTLPPFEVVVCDDGSTDSTVAILEEFRSLAPFPVRISKNSVRLGSTCNFDQALRMARGDLIALCDQDDRWLERRLECLAAALETDPEALAVFSDAELIDAESNPIGTSLLERNGISSSSIRQFVRDPLRILLRHDVVTGATMMIRRNLLSCFGGIPDSWLHDSWLTWMAALHGKIAFVQGTPTMYRVHVKQQVGVGGRKSISEIFADRARRRAFYERSLSAFVGLEDYCRDRNEIGMDIKCGIAQKCRFLRSHLALSTNEVVRAAQIARMLHWYFLYDRGPGTVVKDLLGC
jgi:glycosyltransferase involved in cell wall biosynthesis